MDAIHNVRFPLRVSFGATGGPERRTEIVTLGSGREERNQRWQDSRRRFDAGTGVRNRDDLAMVVEFFEERRGRLYGFRFMDPPDYKSSLPSEATAPGDQLLGVGDGERTDFQLIKRYGDAFAPYDRIITLPVVSTLKVQVGGVDRVVNADFLIGRGLLSFLPHAVPRVGEAVTAGFEFEVPARFDTDWLEVDLSRFNAGSIPSIPIVEILL